MKPQELLQAGHLDEAITALGAELREQPSDARRRMFLFELLCFAGNYDRAEKQLAVLEETGGATRETAMFFRLVLAADRLRQSMSEAGEFPQSGGASGPGKWNGAPFTRLGDADPRLESHFEFMTPAGYHRIPLSDLLSVEMDAPARLRELIWSPARIRFRRNPDEQVEVLLPVLTPGAFRHADPQVRLGRMTVWEERDGVEVPCGQRMFRVDNTDEAVLDLRRLELDGTA